MAAELTSLHSCFIAALPHCRRSRPLQRPALLLGRRNVAGGPSRAALAGEPPADGVSAKATEDGGSNLTSSFCIIEGRDTIQDFAEMQLQEIRDNVASRRNRIFLLMEEVRRLRIQQRIKSKEQNVASEEYDEEMPEYPSSIPFLPPLTTDTLDQYYAWYITMVATVIFFGGWLAPSLELRLGVGGTSYEDFIRSVHLPLQLSQVDPIVASFAGGAVGVISALLLVEVNNVKQQERKRCRYCRGTGYLACARCSGSGVLLLEAAAGAERCPNCAGSAKVMCPTCLCTGRALATEHDPRIDPFD